MQLFKKWTFLILLILCKVGSTNGQDTSIAPVPVNNIITQYNILSIQSPFTLYTRRDSFKKYLMEKTIKETFSGPLNPNTAYNFEDACLSATQFLIKNQYSRRGFDKMFEQYFQLDNSTRFALLSAVNGIYPVEYAQQIKQIIPYERDPKLFSMAVLYEFRIDHSIEYVTTILKQIQRQFAQAINNPILNELTKYLTNHRKEMIGKTPPLKELFNYQRLWKQKTIYSFQRWNRDFSGICIVQYEDGSFAKDSAGRLLTFRQLARSGSNLPYFISNGNTPQGIYRIAGESVSIDKLIGPTPNLQSIIPFQNDSVYYRNLPVDPQAIPLDNYKTLLPPSWQNYAPMTQSFYAGLIGRRYIVIHGSTLDPSFFLDWSFYPLTPTDGCLEAPEQWNGQDGQLAKSEQLNLVNTYLKTPSKLGMLVVVNLDDQPKNITATEIETLIKNYEQSQAH